MTSQLGGRADGISPEMAFVLSRTPVALCYIDGEFRYRFVNAAWSNWTGISADDAVGKPMWHVIPIENFNVIRPHLARGLAGERTRYETPLTHPSGEVRWLRTAVIPEHAADGSVPGVMITIDDITRRRNAEMTLQRERELYAEHLEREVERRTLEVKALHQRMMHSERLRTTEEMAGSVAHAVHNPLQALLGTVEMARRDMLDPSLALERIHHLAQRIEGVIQGTLRLVRNGSLERELHTVKSLCEKLMSEIEPLARKSGVDLVWSIADSLPPLAADASLLVAALVSIVENALFVTPDGGRIDLRVEPVQRASVVRFTIDDCGPGIPVELRTRVLEPFFTTKGRGTGLGLSIAQGILHGHMGTLRFDSRQPRGTRVIVDLPAGDLFQPPLRAASPDPAG